ncbi:MAG TPA: AAA family ATPase [Candidatus Angelobacter sp.]|nr:AAA family ATPase [Candidatus Angelobacter sp.]
MPAQTYSFGPFRLDVRERQLVCDRRVIPLRGKVFDTLCVLVHHAGRLLHKDELMKAIWPDSVVEENNLEHNLSVLRKVLGQNHSGEKLIETVPRQGYRFIAKVHVLNEAQAEEPAGAVLTASALDALEPITERDSQLQQLHQALKRAQSGLRQTVFLTGEAGIGKTTLVRKFLDELKDVGPLRTGLGECLDQRGPGEAYMPVLEAFARLCRQSDGQPVVEVLKRRAPTWLFQIPSAISPDERSSLQHTLIGLTRERMLREGVDAVQAIAADRTLVLVLEDLHWSDGSTLDFLMRVARGREPAKLLVLGTFRPAEARNGSKSVAQLVQQLRVTESCQELPLGFLSAHGVSETLRNRLQGTVPSSIAHLLHQRSEGNPLFATVLVNFWISNGCLRARNGEWTLSVGAGDADLETPDTLRQFIQEQVDQLPPAEQKIVEAASVAGIEFCVSAVAAALSRPAPEIETQCATMAQAGRFFAICGWSDWPDGTVCQRYRFIHSLYREIIYKRLPAGQRSRWHLRIGERLERAAAGQKEQAAPELAQHFQQGRDARRAIHYLKQAAQQCLERGAAADAVFHLTSGLELLRRIPEQKERAQLELGIHAILAPALGASKGLGDLETEAAFRRAYELARQLGEEERQFPIVFGFAVMLELRGQYRKAQELMESHLPHEELRGGYMLEGLDLLACSRFHQGAFADALKHAERGATASCLEVHSALSGPMGENPGIDCYAWVALSLWFLGHPEQAVVQAEHAVSLAETPAHAYSRSTVYSQRAFLHQLRREKEETRSWSQRTIRLAIEQGFRYREAVGKVLHGWSLAQLGQVDLGISELKEGITGCRAAGAELDVPYHLALLAEAYMRARDGRRANATLREAIEQVKTNHSFFYEAELWRLQGHLHWAFDADRAAASECFLHALEVAQQQGARSLELRAAVSMAQLLRDRGESGRGAELLAPVYRSFAGQGETPDLRDARLELEALQERAAGASRPAV